MHTISCNRFFCIEDSHGDGHKEKKDQMKKILNQCQYCADAACKDHTEQLCHNCIRRINDQ